MARPTTPSTAHSSDTAGTDTTTGNLSCDLDFYWTVASGCSRKAIREAQHNNTVEDHDQTVDCSQFDTPEHAMVSFETVNNKPWIGPEWFIDSGGFSALTNSDRARFETSIEDYIEYLRTHLERGVNITRWALRDWPYEKDLLREYERDIRDHQRWTVRDHIECLECADDYGVLDWDDADPVPVLQGRSVDDYLWHLDYMLDHGLIQSAVGIGSLVGRNSITETQSIIEQVREALPNKYSIHGFGVKNQELNNPDAISQLDSVDTAAWNYSQTMKATYNENVRNTWIENLKAYQSYRDRLEEVFNSQSDASGTTVMSLGQFNSAVDVGWESSFPLLECRCGTLIDWNAIADEEDFRAVSGTTCRNCKSSVMNAKLARDGLLCDPKPGLNNHHPLCSCND